MKIKQIGEFALVERIKKQISKSNKNTPSIIVGPGDDAFVSKIPSGYLLVATKDILIEGIHFKRKWASAYQLGYKAIAVNLSDLAAMGNCTPLYALIGVALPKGTGTDFVRGLYEGMLKISKKYGLKFAGGDTTGSRNGVVISVTLLGLAKKNGIVLRSGAKPGDSILVSGMFGDSGAGLYVLGRNLKRLSQFQKYLVNKHLMPEPRVKEAKALAKSGLLTSLMDSSDGLFVSVNFIAKESGVGAEICLERVPVSKQLKALSSRFKRINPVDMALSGGEDYELVFTAKPEDVGRIRKILPAARVIGRMTKEKGVRFYLNGVLTKMRFKGFEHFK